MTLYLLPNTFYDDQPIDQLLPHGVFDILQSLQGIIGESERATRRYLVKVLKGSDFSRNLPIQLLNEHSSLSEIQTLVSTIKSGGNWALLSDAGLSCIADPGSLLIRALHRGGFHDVISIGCPSSILMALQLSGLSGQHFTFHGYLAPEKEERIRTIRKAERESITQICIETPYRNKALFHDFLETLHPETLLCVAQEVGCPEQKVRTYSITHWKERPIEPTKVPTVFLWQRGGSA